VHICRLLPYRLDFGDTTNENEVISMIATTPRHLELLDAIEHLPSGGVLSFEDMAWREYEKLWEALGDSSNVRVSYDSGRLEILSPSDWHDYYKTLLGHLYGLSGQNYVEVETSDLFPFLTPQALESFLDQDYIQGFNDVKRKFRKWVQAHK
jgi:hypothetical protein